ncbi:hypothetical protein [Mameliella sediminis]|uniref:hypothetical protein n=1 Tax=Mameliella sediminis TaxID=2836866 RepID=UPI001C463EA8|nr:hypothetical protein [Mameliella sediminis]MBV7396767.1 hypothetical protein [Mameliella sediminis]
MDDLYDEVMALLHDTGAFAEWQQDAGVARSVDAVRNAAHKEIPPLAMAQFLRKRSTDPMPST